MGFNHLCPPAMFANKYTAVTATDRWYVAEIRRWPVRIPTQLNSAGRAGFSRSRALFRNKNVGASVIYEPPDWIHMTYAVTEWRGLTGVQVSKQGCVSITSWQHLTWHFMTPARHTKRFSYYYFNYFRHVAMLQKLLVLLWWPFLWGPCSAEHAEHA